MASPDYSKLIGTNFETIVNDLPIKKSSKTQKAKDVKINSKIPDFKRKLDNGLWDDFTYADWVKYFEMKALEFGVKYIRGDCRKEKSILDALIKRFDGETIKLMMDFVWDAPHTMTDKKAMGIWIFSKGWLNSIYQSSLEWHEGEFNKQKIKAPNTVREWRGEKADSDSNVSSDDEIFI